MVNDLFYTRLDDQDIDIGFILAFIPGSFVKLLSPLILDGHVLITIITQLNSTSNFT